jgi:nucleoside-diphosphate-sugar epimerase
MKILVTGALGHIGSHLIRELPKAFPESEIILIDSLLTQRFSSLFDLPSIKSFKFFNADIREFNFNNILDNDSYIINLAAITDAAGSFENSEEVERNNFDCTHVLAEAASKSGAKLIHISSTSVYGTQSNLVDESCPDDELNPQSPYAECKLREESLLKKYSESKNLKFLCFRFGTIYGFSIGMRFHTAVNKFCWQACLGDELTVWETAYHQRRPYLDLNDAAMAIIFSIENNLFKNTTYNVLTNNLTVKEVSDTIKKYIPDMKIKFVTNKIMNQLSYEVSPKKFLDEGFSYKGDIEKAIKETIFNLPHNS